MTWRSERERFGIYRVRGGQPELVATTPDAEGVGVTLVTLAGEGEFAGVRVGVLDSRGDADGTGLWIVNPYEKGGQE